MAEVKDVLNDVYLVYKTYKQDGDLKAWNERMGQLTKKYKGDKFYTNIALAVGVRISEERSI